MRKLFGTDGIRGRANQFPMTSEMAMNLGRAVTYYFQKNNSNLSGKPLIILGKDTRLSCYMLELAFSSGVCSQGGRVVLTGPLPTPGVSFVTRNMRAHAGVMISASHNQYYDNGIKLFDANGDKLPDSVELEIEKMVLNPTLIKPAPDKELGRAQRLDEVIGRYIVQVKSCLDKKVSLDGMRVVLDCANGAGYKVGPMILSELGAEVFSLGVNPNGQNINLGVGSLHPEIAAEDVKKYKAEIGICLDGDADRVVIIDEKGDITHGDILIGILAKFSLETGMIKKGEEIVGTVMSNMALENYIEGLGLKFYRAKVGDRYILERMRKSKSKLGGEPSGHIIWPSVSRTGDGILSALKVLEAMNFYQKPFSALKNEFELYPQMTTNVTVKKKEDFKNFPEISSELKKQEGKLKGKGRILLRYSGTESLARVMVEGESMPLIEEISDVISGVVSKCLG